MGWSIGADQMQFFQGVMVMIGGKSVFVNKIETADGTDFEISPGGELVLSGDNRLKLGKRIYLGDSGTSHSIYYDADGLHIESILPIRMHPVLATGIEAPEAKFTTLQAENAIISNLYHGGTWTGSGPGRWSMGADQYYEPVAAAYNQDGKLIQTNRLAATDGSWKILDDGTGYIGGTVYAPQEAAEDLDSGEIVYSSGSDEVSLASASGVAGQNFPWGFVLDEVPVASGTNAMIGFGGYAPRILLESGLSPTAGEYIYLSENELGAATNVSPSGVGNYITPLGVILNTENYATYETVSAAWNPQGPEVI